MLTINMSYIYYHLLVMCAHTSDQKLGISQAEAWKSLRLRIDAAPQIEHYWFPGLFTEMQ